MCKHATASLASQTLSVPQCRLLSVLKAISAVEWKRSGVGVGVGVGCETMQQLGGSGGKMFGI